MDDNIPTLLTPGEIRALVDPHDFAYYTGLPLRGISYTLTPQGWQVIFRAIHQTKGPVYCLYVAVDLETALRGLLTMVSSKGGSRYWYPDKYAK